MRVEESLPHLANARGAHTSERKQKSKAKRRTEHKALERLAHHRKRLGKSDVKRYEEIFGEFKYANIVRKWLSPNTLYLITNQKSPFYIDLDKVTVRKPRTTGPLRVPKHFSLIDKPDETYAFIASVIRALLCEKSPKLTLDYNHCEELDIGAQVLLDVVMKDIFAFYDKCSNRPTVDKRVGEITKGVSISDPSKTPDFVKKILYSVGSFAIHREKRINFPDIVSYPLCIHDREGSFNLLKAIERKDIDTTDLAEYVISSLAKMHKVLTPDAREDLCVIIGEVLINAEEHATTNHRFSIGYFQDKTENGRHVGLFRLAIMNFGKTIYEKFADLNCPNKAIVRKMRELSERYTKKRFFSGQEFEEETLWTLYALQEGVTSVADRKRGHGSIQFIDSFFNLNGDGAAADQRSRMNILSGNTNITFNNKYRIKERVVRGESLKVMTFNDTGNIEERPDQDNVRYVTNYFPGTMISARIVFDEEDFAGNESGKEHD